jgi:ABC-2 type transport system permease protein
MFNEIYILWLRQITRYVRSKSRLISSLGQPLLFLIAFGFGFGPIFQKAGGGNYIDFLAPGIIAMGILSISMFNGIEVIWDKQFGFLKETLVAPISRLSIVTGRTLGGATVALAQGIIILLVTLLIGFRPEIAMLPLALVFMFLIGLLFTSIGTAIASILEDMHAFPVIMNFVIMPLFFLSGALFPLDSLPPSIAQISYFNPLSYGVDGLRGTLSMSSHFGIGIDLLVLVLCIAVSFFACAKLFSKIQA